MLCIVFLQTILLILDVWYGILALFCIGRLVYWILGIRNRATNLRFRIRRKIWLIRRNISVLRGNGTDNIRSIRYYKVIVLLFPTIKERPTMCKVEAVFSIHEGLNRYVHFLAKIRLRKNWVNKMQKNIAGVVVLRLILIFDVAGTIKAVNGLT